MSFLQLVMKASVGYNNRKTRNQFWLSKMTPLLYKPYNLNVYPRYQCQGENATTRTFWNVQRDRAYFEEVKKPTSP